MKKSETERILASIDAFSHAMKAKMIEKYEEGRSGWDDPANKDEILYLLHDHVVSQAEGNNEEVDIANFAMMLWCFKHQA